MINKNCCDNCKYYHWYEDRCEKYQCEVDARSLCSDFKPNNSYKEYIYEQKKK